MRHLTFLLAATLLVLLPFAAFAPPPQRLVVDDGYCSKDGSNDLVCDLDTSAADGIESKQTRFGDIKAGRCIEVGGTAGAGSCICRDSATDRLWGNKDCDDPPVKDAGEEFLDEIPGGGGGGAPTSAEYIVAETDATLLAEVAPSAANQVPVSSSTSIAAWASPTGTIGDDLFANYQLPTTFSPPLPLTNKLLRGALSDLTFNVLPFNTADSRSEIVPVYHNTWAEVFAPGIGFCDSGQIDNGVRHIQTINGDCTNSGACTPGTNCVSTLCGCGPLDATRYGPVPGYLATHTHRDRHFWTFAYSGYAEANDLQPYPYILDGAQYPRPLMRLDVDGGTGTPVQPGSCLAAYETENLATWNAGRENSIHIKVMLNNPANNFTVSNPRNKQMVSFVGWQRNLQDNSVGTNLILNPAGTTPATVMPTATSGTWEGNRNSVGLLWYGPTMTWYGVWHRDGVNRMYVVKTFTEGEFNTNLLEGGAFNYFATWLQNGSGNSDSDSTGNKNAVYATGVSEHNAYNTATSTPGLGTPFQSGAGYRRVVATCALNIASGTNSNMHFLVQKMDVIR